MGENIFKLNAEKTKQLCLETWQQLTNLTISQLHLVTAASSSAVDIASTACNLEVIFYSQLTMSAEQAYFIHAADYPLVADTMPTCALV